MRNMCVFKGNALVGGHWFEGTSACIGIGPFCLAPRMIADNYLYAYHRGCIVATPTLQGPRNQENNNYNYMLHNLYTTSKRKIYAFFISTSIYIYIYNNLYTI